MKSLNKIALILVVGITTSPTKMIQAKDVNRLNWVEISQTKLSTQIMFDFVNPVQCHPELDKETRNLNLNFPGMNLADFDATHVHSQLSSLKTDGILKTIVVSEKSRSGQNINLALEFSPSRTIKNPKTSANQTVTNKFLIKWSVLENPHRLIVDIFIKENLDRLMKKDAVLLYAANDVQQYDTPIKTTTKKLSSSHPRIVIDPGHGGANTGTKGHHQLVEKDITLDISRRVHAMLKKKGLNPLLIRNSDKDITLLERVQLAHQLQGDLFVSIHANSAGRMDSNASGLETFYLDGDSLLAEHNQTGFSFVNLDTDHNIIKNLNTHIKTTLSNSKILAEHIQSTVINTLAQKNIPIVNRGVKPDKFRVLLQTGGASIPASLVEVGFLTNRTEASKLATPAYRTIIAQGICDGICSYLDAQ